MSVWRRLAVALGFPTAQPAESPDAERPMKLIVGLGNQGRKYIGTRHNIGYEVVERLAEDYGQARFRRQFQGLVASSVMGDQRVLLLKPETYMNRSGYSVQPALAFHGLDWSHLLVIC